MDTKLVFVGYETKMSNPDILLMQYSNREAIHGFATTFCKAIHSGCTFHVTAINYSTRYFDWVLDEGYVTVNNEMLKVDSVSGTTYLANNVPSSGVGTFRIFLQKTTTYNTLGDKQYVNGVTHSTWKNDRGYLTFNNYLTDPDDTQIEIALMNYVYSGSVGYTVTMFNENAVYKLAQDKIVENNNIHFGTLTANKAAIIDGANKITASTYGKPNNNEANSVAVIGASGLTSNYMVYADSNNKLSVTVDAVFVKKYDIGAWDMTANNDPKDFLFSSLGLPLGYTILKVDVAIIDDDGATRYNYSNTINNGDSPLVVFNTATPFIQVLNNSYYAGSPLYNGTTESRGYLLIHYVL